MSTKQSAIEAAKCENFAHWKQLRPTIGMCQCPSEAVTRGAAKMRGWRQTEASDRCWTHEFRTLLERAKEQQE